MSYALINTCCTPVFFNLFFNIRQFSDKTPRKRKNSNVDISLNKHQSEALIGLILGDVSIEKSTPNSNVRLRFDQSLNLHSDYLYFLYELFKEYTLTSPKATNRKPDQRTGKIYNSLNFKTRMLPCFNYY